MTLSSGWGIVPHPELLSQERRTVTNIQSAHEEEDGTLVVTDSRVDPSQFILAGIDTSNGPVFSVGEVGRFFFARTSHWMRWLERNNKLVLDGETVADGRSQAGSRKYTLSDVEQAAHALASNRAISGAQLRIALTLVAVQSELHGYK